MADPTLSLQQLSDLEHIRTCKHRYFRAIDTADLELLESVLTEDVVIDYRGGSYRVAFTGREKMLEFIANSFHSGAAAMHHGHMPEITFTGADTAEGIWYLQDIFVNTDINTITSGSAIYKDRYVRDEGTWRIAHTEYDRVTEFIEPMRDDFKITAQYLADKGRKPDERTDMSHLITIG